MKLLNGSSRRDASTSEKTSASASSQQDKTTTASKPTEPAPVAKGWLKRMEPPKGGTEPPDAKFLAVAAVVTSAGFYAWFIDPSSPTRREEV